MKSGKRGFIVFLIFIILLILGGNYLYNESKDKESNIDKKKEEKINIKIDDSKDYVYYYNEKVISESGELYYKDIFINVLGFEEENEINRKENEVYNSNIKYLSDVSDLNMELVNYNNDNIYSVVYRDYKTYTYNNYLSIMFTDFIYTCFDQSTIKDYKSYIIDLNNGNNLNTDNILSIYSLNTDMVKEKVRGFITEKQQIVDDVELIKIDDTVNDYQNYSYYIDNVGDLYINFIVKTNKIDYNETMKLN